MPPPDPPPNSPGHAPSTKPEPLGDMLLISLVTTSVLCVLFLLWRKANMLKGVIGYRLANISGRGEGRIRLSEDDGPASHEFLADDDDPPHDGEVLGVGDEQRVWRRDA